MPYAFTFYTIKEYFSKRINAVWFMSVLVVTIIHLSTISFAPYLHLDEFMIIDLGRTILNPNTNWSIAWMTSLNQPVYIWFYLGSVIQEFIYQATGEYGPRIFSLAGALIAALAMFRWLLLRGIERVAACILSLVFLMDPLFVQSYSMGRVDSWTMACCIASCAVLQNIKRATDDHKIIHRQIALAGTLVTIAVLIWPSAIFLIPLVIIELFQVFSKKVNTIKAITYFVLGGLVTGIILVLPITQILISQVSNILNGFATNTRSGSGQASIFSSYPLEQIKELLRILKFTPILIFMTLIAGMGWMRKELFLGTLVALMIMVFTVVYIQRVQYLLPYFIVILAEIFRRRELTGDERSKVQWLKFSGLTLLLIWCIGISVISRTVLAFDNNRLRDRMLIYDAAASLIGAGNHTVFMPGEFYYPGRDLGWKMYKPYLAQNEPLTYDTFRQVLPHVDYVIWTGKSAPQGFQQELLNDGMTFKKTYQIAGNNEKVKESITITRLRGFFSIYLQPYGTYALYTRNKH